MSGLGRTGFFVSLGAGLPSAGAAPLVTVLGGPKILRDGLFVGPELFIGDIVGRTVAIVTKAERSCGGANAMAEILPRRHSLSRARARSLISLLCLGVIAAFSVLDASEFQACIAPAHFAYPAPFYLGRQGEIADVSPHCVGG